jgi:GNAT superfamily N-acetyltransferase
MIVRTALPADAGEACGVIRRSIEELCLADHRGDAEVLQGWLANKTPETVLSWIEAADQRVLVAVEAEAILGVGAAAARGEITLNYISPHARFRGASKAVMLALEDYLRGKGNQIARLTSMITALRFYRALGYRDFGPAETWRGIGAQPMVRLL